MLKEMIPGGLSYGANYLVEFEPQSLWYETSLTLTAEALKQGVRTDYHTFMHVPSEVKESLSRLGLDISRLEGDTSFRVLDSYTGSTFLGPPQTIGARWRNFEKSLDLKDWAAGISEESTNPLERDKNRLHVDDNTSVLLQHNSEKSFIDYWRTHIILNARILNLSILHAAVTGVYSDTFYSQFEALCDGVIEFRGREENGQIEQYVRVRTIRGKPHDSRWRHLRLLENGGVVAELARLKESELGVRDWLKGPRK